MSDLTRDEIRRACEAVPGWEWHEGVAYEPSTGYNRPRFRQGDRWTEDALALLEATGEDYEIQRHRSGFSVGFIALDWLEHDPDLTTAAVRAVGQRKKVKKGETTP